nr:hypothetical protein [Tanacetum cinerariifolium]
QKPVQATKGTRFKTKAKVATRRSKTQFPISQASGSSDGTDFESRVLDEQHLKTTGVDEGTGTIPGVPDVPIYESKNRDEIPDPNLTNIDQTEHDEEDVDERVHTPLEYELTDDEKIHDKENIDDEDRMDDEEEDEKTDEPVLNSSVSSNFTSKLLNLENPSPADNEITSLMDTTAHHATSVPKITSSFTTTIPPPRLFNDKVTNLEKDMSELKQVDQYAQAIFLIPAIIDRYMDNKLGEAIHKVIQSHNTECREEAQAEKQEYIDNVDSIVRTIIKKEVKTQLLKILPKVVSAFATLVIERNVTESLEVAVLARSSSQPMSTYEATASLPKFELTKILLNKMEENNSHLRADYKKKLYDALVESYNTEKDLLNAYGVQQDQEFDMGNNDEQPADKETVLNFSYEDKGRYISVTKVVTVKYDKHAYWGTSHLGPKRQHFYGFVANMSSSKDVYSRKRIIAVTRLSIIKKYDYDHLEETEVRREDQILYKFREGYLARLRLQDIEDMLLLLVK